MRLVPLALAAFVLFGPSGGCGSDRPRPSDIARHPEDYLGRSLTVEGPIARVMTGRAFLLGTELSDEESLLVITPSAIDFEEPPGARGRLVRVSGRVGTVRIAEIAESFGSDWDDRLRNWEGRAALYADSVVIP